MSVSVIEQAALLFWEQLDCPTAQKLHSLGTSGRWQEVLTMTVSPEDFTSHHDYIRANAAVCFLKKNPFVRGSSADARQSKAMKSWEDGEVSCFRANERLARFCVSPLSDDAPAEFLRRVRRRLLSWLRQAPGDEELRDSCRHGPGTTFSSTADSPTAADKYSDVLTLTSDCVWYLPYILGTLWGAELSGLSRPYEVVPGNRHTFVPKTALTDRNIAIEPSFNIWLQLGVGGVIRRRLAKYAQWDLNSAAELHKSVAQFASRSGTFATLDLTNASDSLCKNLVRILLRDTGWLPILEDLRSPRTRVDGQWRVLEKFSSMGNGYTFELETAIFAAIVAECLVLRGHEPEFGWNLFVFGDDIIIPTDTADLVTEVLAWLGFEVNRSKSFSSGPFRESCGGDYFNGRPVRGYYLKHELSNEPSAFFALHNGGKRILEACGVDPFKFLEWVLRHIPERLRALGGPDRLGDSVLHGVSEVFTWKRGIRWTKVYVAREPVVVGWHPFSDNVRLACRLTGHGANRGIVSRGYRRVLRTEWISTS